MGSDLFKMILIPTWAHSTVNSDRIESHYVGSDSDSRPHLLAVIVSKKKIFHRLTCNTLNCSYSLLYVEKRFIDKIFEGG